MTTIQTVPAPEIQITTYNKEYTLNLENFANASLSFGDTIDENAKALFEKTLLCKIFGIEYNFTKNSDNKIIDIDIAYYKSLKYNMMYAIGNDDGDTKKCLFGIVSNFKATGKTETDDPYSESTTKVNIKDLEIEGPYFFILAHKNATEGTNATPEKDILRVHKIVQCPNTHFVAAKEGTTTCGLFGGPVAPSSEKDCIFGFFNIKIGSDNTDTDVFYMPMNSCCLEGRSREIINLPFPAQGGYPGYFKVTKPFIGVA